MVKHYTYPGDPFEIYRATRGGNEGNGTRKVQASGDGTLMQWGPLCLKEIAISADFDNSEQDSGFDLPAKCVFLGAWVDVTTADSGETLDVGTNGSGSDDPNGFLAAVSVGTTGVVGGSVANGSNTLGALLTEQSGATGGENSWSPDTTSGGESVTYTGSAVTNTMRGSIFLLYLDLA